ncbi:MAG: NfeD family protein [Agathobacter sp.]|nr:NfeD family protein [Agathobacter sp.]
MDTGVYILIWLILTIVFVIAELATVGLVSIWFAAGSLITLIAAALGAPLPVQIILFLAISIALLLATRPFAKKFINSRTQATNVDSVIGEKARVTERVSNLDLTGKAVVRGQEWTVRTDNDNEIIDQGELIEVLRVSGVKLIVRKAQQTN